MKKFLCIWTVLSVALLTAGCRKHSMQGEVQLQAVFSFEGRPVAYNTGVYTLASGEKIRIADIQMFVSDVCLWQDAGLNPDDAENAGAAVKYEICAYPDNVWYIDSDLPATLTWNTKFPVKSGIYGGVEFTYGLDSARNRSNVFANAPEKDMFWPEKLGGGYHYMKINGWWAPEGTADTVTPVLPFGFHAGIGQTYSGETPVAFHQNYVRKRDTLRVFLEEQTVKTLYLNVDVAEFFNSPHIWRFEEFGGSIMQNQAAQQVIKENAPSAFSLTQ